MEHPVSQEVAMNPVHFRLWVALLAVAIGPTHGLVAQVGAPKKENRIAVVNIGTVILKYEKAKIIKAEMDKLVGPFKERAEKLKVEALKLKEQHAVEANPAVKTVLLDALNDAQRRLETLDQEAKAKISKRQEEMLVGLYKDVHAAIKEHAEDHGIQIVVGFGEPPQDDELFAYTNVNRKLAALDAGSASLLYFHPDLDISKHVVERLNRTLKRDTAGK
jgi:Skp family chaperone for outer membrane proteins